MIGNTIKKGWEDKIQHPIEQKIIKEEEKKEKIRNEDTIDMFFKMTDAQIATYSNKLSRLPEFSHLAHGNEGYDALTAKIAKMLKDETQQKIFTDALKNLGFKF